MGNSLKKVGLLGGSFDPIHKGHLQLALFLKEKGSLDEVLLIPAHISPFKTSAPPCASCQHRLSMIQLAIQGFPALSVSDVECRRLPPSYTIDTVRSLSSEPDLQLFLLLSSGSLQGFSSWKDAKELVQLAFPLIADTEPEISFPFPSQRFTMQGMKVSSTMVRDRLHRGLDCNELLPPLVLNYIFTHHLYGT